MSYEEFHFTKAKIKNLVLRKKTAGSSLSCKIFTKKEKPCTPSSPPLKINQLKRHILLLCGPVQTTNHICKLVADQMRTGWQQLPKVQSLVGQANHPCCTPDKNLSLVLRVCA